MTGPVTQEFGHNGHPGIDIAAPAGTPIQASAAGVVTRVATTAQSGGYGNLVVIDSGSGLTEFYAHQSSVAVTKGQHVNEGDIIGYVGSTGYSTGNHLHEEVRENDKPVNPRKYLGAGTPTAGASSGPTQGLPVAGAAAMPSQSPTGATSILDPATLKRAGLIIGGGVVVLVGLLVAFKPGGPNGLIPDTTPAPRDRRADVALPP